MMAMTPDLGSAGNILVFIICTLNWFNGLIVPYDQIQVFWRYWLYYLSPFTYLLSGLSTAVIAGQEVVCSQEDLSSFPRPNGSTCAEYAGEWVAEAGAQLLGDAGQLCQVCKWSVGDQFLKVFGLGTQGTGLGGLGSGASGVCSLRLRLSMLALCLGLPGRRR
jgi:ABC-type multidrug transport system permease subunit